MRTTLRLPLVHAVLLATGCSGGSKPSTAPEPDATSAAIAGIRTYSNLSHEHTSVRQQYPTKPPVGGPHWPPKAQGVYGWQQCGDYTEPVVDEFAVHSLEHGAVWLTYNKAATPADIAQLQQLRQIRADYELLSPYPGQPSAITATAWGVQLSVTTARDPRLADFIRNYAGGGQGGEPGADCAHGSTLAQATAAVAAAR